MRKSVVGFAIGLAVCGCAPQRQVGPDPLVGYSETGIPIRQHTSTFAITPFPEEISLQVAAYSNCLSDAFVKAANRNNADRTGLRENWLASCAGTRLKEIAEADQALRNAGWAEPRKREAILKRTFDEQDAVARASAQEFLPAAGL